MDQANDAGGTALICASSHGYDACVGRLLEAGATVDQVNNEGDTALIYACYSGHSACVERLLEAQRYDFLPPFSVTLYLLRGDPYRRSLVSFVVSHAFSDGYSGVPLIEDQDVPSSCSASVHAEP